MANVKQIVERLIEAVPPPRVAPPHPQDSWATLKMGDVLRRPDTTVRGLGDQVLGLWEVCDVTSAGVKLSNDDGLRREWSELTDRNWKELGWRKLGKRELAKLRETDSDQGKNLRRP